MEDQHACFELRLGKQLVVVHTRFPRDIFLPENSRFVVVRYRQVVDRWYCEAMESQVSLASCLIRAHQPHEADKIVVAGSDLDEVGVGWLAVFDLKVLSRCFEERGEFFR